MHEGSATEKGTESYMRCFPGLSSGHFRKEQELFGMKNVKHVRENLETAISPPVPPETVLALFSENQ